MGSEKHFSDYILEAAFGDRTFPDGFFDAGDQKLLDAAKRTLQRIRNDCVKRKYEDAVKWSRERRDSLRNTPKSSVQPWWVEEWQVAQSSDYNSFLEYCLSEYTCDEAVTDYHKLALKLNHPKNKLDEQPKV